MQTMKPLKKVNKSYFWQNMFYDVFTCIIKSLQFIRLIFYLLNMSGWLWTKFENKSCKKSIVCGLGWSWRWSHHRHVKHGTASAESGSSRGGSSGRESRRCLSWSLEPRSSRLSKLFQIRTLFLYYRAKIQTKQKISFNLFLIAT